jgi:hypothetical protein
MAVGKTFPHNIFPAIYHLLLTTSFIPEIIPSAVYLYSLPKRIRMTDKDSHSGKKKHFGTEKRKVCYKTLFSNILFLTGYFANNP